MILKNRFSNYVKSLFASVQPCCLRCNSNDRCSIHHIFGTLSDSMFNGITLCFDCHRIADSFNVIGGYKGKEIRREFLFLTFQAFYKNTWWELYLPEEEIKKNDEFFILIKDELDDFKRYML